MNEPATPRTIAGKYELEKLLGQGGMGEVWVATELSSGRKLAVKLLKSVGADMKENRGRFEREAHIAATLVSPHICQVTDSGVDGEGEGDPFMVLELLHGEDLQKRIKSEKELPLAQVVRLAIQVGRALHVAHVAGLVHRDLKPANIFLARQGDEEVVKVLDFGIAKANSLDASEYTTAGAMLGTASYMSPEQIRNAKTVDHRADLWALAVVLFRSLTGQFPFEQTGFDLFLALTQDPIPTPLKVTSLVASLPAPLNVFFERSFAQDMSQRYPSASASIVGFCRAAGVTVPPDILHADGAPISEYPPSGQPVSAHPPSAQPLSGHSMSGQALSAQPLSGHSMSGSPPSHAPIPGAAPFRPRQESPLAGTLMLDRPPVSSEPAAPRPAAGRAPEPMTAPEGGEPDELDATLFYQPGLKASANESPVGAGPAGAGFMPPASRPLVFTYPLDAARAASRLQGSTTSPGSQSPPDLARASYAAQLPLSENPQPRATPPPRRWPWLVVSLVVSLGFAAAWFFFLRAK